MKFPLFAKYDEPIEVLYGPPPGYFEKRKIEDKKNIIFDFGGVLMKHNLEGCKNAFRQFMSEDDIENVLGFGNNKPDTLRAQFETRWHHADWFFKELLPFCTSGTTPQQIIDAWNIMHAGISWDKWLRLRILRNRGYHLYLMSNTDEIHWEHTLSLYRYQIEQVFESKFLSFNYRFPKPDPSFFKEVDRSICADPKLTYFVDDTEANRIAAEQSVGWHTCADFKELFEIIKS